MLMDILYTTQAILTFDEYKRFSLAVRRKNSILYMILILILYILGLNYIMYITGKEMLIGLIMCILFSVIFIVAFWLANQNLIKKTYYNNKFTQDLILNYEFYPDYIMESCRNGTSKLYYKDIYGIMETKTNLYIMSTKNQGMIILKEKCSLELMDYIKGLGKRI